MARTELDTKPPVDLTEQEDEETLAAIDRGIADADTGRVTPIEEVEKMLPQVDFKILLSDEALRSFQLCAHI
ncbi:MAG TPA: hypothetical protein VKM93_23130 [Terriglobia bacterium]|nr:hypothetical protein [Terriglobia bacterium]